MKYAFMIGVLLWQFGSNQPPVPEPIDVPAIQGTTEQEYDTGIISEALK